MKASTTKPEECAKAAKQNKKPDARHSWRWFMGLYCLSLFVIGSFHLLSHGLVVLLK